MSPTPGPEERRRRRALLRAHHPDLGGDAEDFIRVMAVFQAGTSRAGTADEVRFVRRPRGLARLTAWYRARNHRKHRPPRVR